MKNEEKRNCKCGPCEVWASGGVEEGGQTQRFFNKDGKDSAFLWVERKIKERHWKVWFRERILK